MIVNFEVIADRSKKTGLNAFSSGMIIDILNDFYCINCLMICTLLNGGFLLLNVNAKDVFKLPNLLSYFRIILIPFFVYYYVTAEDGRDYQIAGSIVILSGLTDLFDGILARKLNQITDLGKFLDPLADKLTQAAIVACLMMRYEHMWIIVVLFVAKELCLIISNLVLLRKRKVLDGAEWFGKVSTAVFYTCMTILILFPQIGNRLAASLMVITGFFLALSFILYGRLFMKMYKK